jgi:hypothetical protein
MNGFTLYRGPSLLDGAPIIVVATGIAKASTNGKTGDLIQLWIIREDMHPVDAIHAGADASICGTCPHRGRIVDGRVKDRSCYVKVFMSPANVYRTYHKGKYPLVTPQEAREIFAGKRIRLGAYGDPAAVPFDIFSTALERADAWTGYTHAWRSCDPALARFVMASCDNPDDYLEARAAGWRTFRVRLADEPRKLSEVVCPASEEAGKKTTCAACIACGGHGSKAKANIVIIAHGSKGDTNAYARARAA